MNQPELARIYFHSGTKEGIREAKIALSSIQATSFLREALSYACSKIEGIDSLGVYILLGADKNAYIGETESLCERLKHHHSKDELSFWEETIILTGKDDWLTKSHIRYIESELFRRAKKSGWKLHNKKNAAVNAGKLPEADKTITKRFIQQAETLVSMLGYDLFDSQEETHKIEANLSMKGNEYEAYANLDLKTGIVTVLKDSKAKVTEADTTPISARNRRMELIGNETLKKTADNLVFTKNTSFKSKSAAAAVVAAHSINGQKSWKTL